MTPEEREYVRAYENYIGALGDLRIIKDIYNEAAMVYFQSIRGPQ